MTSARPLEWVEVPTPVGPARYAATRSTGQPSCALVLGHGAGGGTGTPDLSALARELPGRGTTVVLVEQPWLVAGRKVAAPPPTLDRGWLAVLAALRAEPDLVPGRLVVGGRSAGARVACRTALATGAVGVLALAFPLHPPGRPEKTRLPELVAAGVPTLVVHGGRDAFGGPEEFPADLPGGTELRPVPYADHSFRVAAAAPLTGREAVHLVVEHTARWLRHLGRLRES